MSKGHKRYAKMKLKGHSSPLTHLKPTVTGSLSWKLYQDCRISLECFLDCLYDNDFTGLIISGNPPEIEIKNAWNKIYLEFHHLSTGGEDSPIVALIKDIQSLNAKTVLVDGIIKFLENDFDQELVDILNKLGLRCTLKITDVNPVPKLKTVLAYAKKFVVERQVKEKELAELQAEKGAETGRPLYYKNLIAISKYQGYGVKASEINLIQYFEIIRAMEREYTNKKSTDAD